MNYQSSNQRGSLSSGQKNRKSSGKGVVGHPTLGEEGMSDYHIMLY